MKFIRCAVCFSAVIVLFATANATQLSCLDYDIGDDSASFLEIFRKALPTTKRNKCIYECMLKSASMVKDNGMIIAEKFVDFVNYVKTLNEYDHDTATKMISIIGKCKNHTPINQDKCENVAIFMKCTSEESKKENLQPRVMINAIHVAFDYAQDVKKWIYLDQISGFGR